MSAATLRISLAVVAIAALGVTAVAGAGTGQWRKDRVRDRVSPTAPANLHATGATTTAIGVAWNASTDNVGVAGYSVSFGNRKITTTAQTSYTVANLRCGQSVTVSVVAFDRSGNRSGRASVTSATAACPDGQPPTTPAGFSQPVTTRTGVVLTWSPSQDNVGVVGYSLYRNLVRVATTAEPNAALSGLVCGSTYSLGVDAVDAAGNRSLIGTAYVATASCGDLEAPTTPANLVVVDRTTTNVSLSWSPSTDDIGVAGYRVSAGGVPVMTVAQPNSTVELACGTRYTLGVEAYDAVGHVSAPASTTASTDACSQSPPADPPPPPSPQPGAPADTTPPSSPSGLAAANITQSSLGLSWNASSDDVGVTGYDVYRNGAKIASVTSTSLSQAGLACGSSYQYAVAALDAAGNVSRQGQLNVATSACSAPAPSDTTAPSVPTGLAASGIGQTGLTVSWTASTDAVGVIGYDIFKNGSKLASVTSTSLAVSGLDCGTSYSFAVAAYDAAGNRSPQAQLNVATSACPAPAPAPPPSPPADTTAPSQPSNLAVSGATATGASLTWSPSTDNVGVTGYRVYVNGTAGPTSTQPSASMSALTCGTAYTFQVDAYDAAGNRSSKASVVGATAACTDTQAPSTPSGVAATSRTATSIALSWSASTDNVGVTGYGLYRGGTASGTTATTNAIFSGLTCNTNYTLAVDAYDAAGNRSSKSTVMVSTTACPDTTPPSTPAGLAVSNVSDSGVTLTWAAASDNVGVTGYDVYRNGTKMATVTSTSAAQTGLGCATSYTLSVIAFDAAGNRSPQAQMTASTSACPAPAPPPPPPPPSSGCTQTVSSGLTSAIQNAAAGATICLAGGSFGNVSLTNLSKASQVTIQPAAGATATLGALTLNNVDHLTFTGSGGRMLIGGLDLDVSSGVSDHLTFSNATWTDVARVDTRGTGDQAILIDGGVFDGLGQGVYEGRVTVRGYNNSQPVGVTISNSHFGGGCSDGVQVIGDANGVQVGPGNEFTGIKQSGCDPVHADPIQFYGAVSTLITGNYFHDNGDGTGGVASFDGDGPATVVNNVFSCTCAYPWSAAAWGGRGWTIRHNVFAGGGSLRFQNSNSGAAPSGNVVRDNLWVGGGSLSTSTSGYGSNDHNLNSGQSGTGNVTGTPVFVGGARPTSYDGFRLSAGSPGKGTASDGTDIGLG